MRRLVHYSIFCTETGRSERLWIQSIRSLRLYNSTIKIHLFVFGPAPNWLLGEARSQHVTVYRFGDYGAYLRSIHKNGDVLALNPTLHKFLGLARDPAARRASQILYLDCDTVFFADVELLFDRYDTCDWYSREEYGTDQELLATIARFEGLRSVEPFNAGVCLLNNRVWDRLYELRTTFLDFVWRLLVGLALSMPKQTDFDTRAKGLVLRAATENDRSRSLPYPSQNSWIIEEIALWLTLGRIADLSQGVLAPEHALQGTEFVEAFSLGRSCIVTHYFSSNESKFFECVPSI